MRLDPEHVQKMRRAVGQDENGGPTVNIDIEFMLLAMSRLTMWERGLLSLAITRSAQSKRLTVEQRVILALFSGGGDDETQ